jgi:hypothetical protein
MSFEATSLPYKPKLSSQGASGTEHEALLCTSSAHMDKWDGSGTLPKQITHVGALT